MERAKARVPRLIASWSCLLSIEDNYRRIPLLLVADREPEAEEFGFNVLRFSVEESTQMINCCNCTNSKNVNWRLNSECHCDLII